MAKLSEREAVSQAIDNASPPERDAGQEGDNDAPLLRVIHEVGIGINRYVAEGVEGLHVRGTKEAVSRLVEAYNSFNAAGNKHTGQEGDWTDEAARRIVESDTFGSAGAWTRESVAAIIRAAAPKPPPLSSALTAELEGIEKILGVENLTAYQANVFLILNDGRAGQRFRDEAALELIAKHSALIADRERRRFEPFATARAIIETEICSDIDTVIESRAVEWSTCPECQERFVPVVNEAHVCGEGLPRNDARGADVSTIADKIATINRLVSEVCEHKRLHVLERVGYYPHVPGSILNAYREGDLDFETAVSLLKAPELSRYERALIFALRAHGDQKRKYSGEPYLIHPIAVAGMLKDAGLDEDAVIAGLLHDVCEDTSVTFEQVESEFGIRVCGLVREVTDFSKPSDGNRANRKRIDREHLATACDDAQSLKVADLISNTVSIVEYDPKFAAVYLPEKRAFLEVLTRAEPGLLARAYAVLEAGEQKICKDKSAPCH